MECGLKSLGSTSAAASPSLMMACRPFPQPPLLPLPQHFQASQAPAGQPADLRARKSPKKPATGAASAPIVVAAPPPAWTSMDSMYSVSPPPSSVPMPTSLLLAAGAGRKKVPTPCAVQVAGAGGGVDVGATDELRRLLRL
ncbi:hypothetical protein D1007_43041 [Hordeum vulgare]|uniref:uncharacterized protein LOC123400169 n=1 Tax=Hordeum vulgare subsp. vulgare TaxID=112509 RepID=UPI001D1A4BA7|nr:uncharacterized protein LOC123400169 [Hordeum vulgare subsp. vulgare]KAE8783521.1 hypothetical protein D1007_43041 [Hordeum vulgare]